MGSPDQLPFLFPRRCTSVLNWTRILHYPCPVYCTDEAGLLLSEESSHLLYARILDQCAADWSSAVVVVYGEI